MGVTCLLICLFIARRENIETARRPRWRFFFFSCDFLFWSGGFRLWEEVHLANGSPAMSSQSCGWRSWIYLAFLRRVLSLVAIETSAVITLKVYSVGPAIVRGARGTSCAKLLSSFQPQGIGWFISFSPLLSGPNPSLGGDGIKLPVWALEKTL